MTAIISRAAIVGGHDGRAEIEVVLSYPNGGTTTISLDEEACLASLDRAGVDSLEELVGQPWSVVLPALVEQQRPENHSQTNEATPTKQKGESCSISSSVTA
jgi:hypothetical protein